MTPLPKRILEWMLKVKYSYNFLRKASYEMGPNSQFKNLFFQSLFIVKFKKLGFSAPLTSHDTFGSYQGSCISDQRPFLDTCFFHPEKNFILPNIEAK